MWHWLVRRAPKLPHLLLSCISGSAAVWSSRQSMNSMASVAKGWLSTSHRIPYAPCADTGPVSNAPPRRHSAHHAHSAPVIVSTQVFNAFLMHDMWTEARIEARPDSQGQRACHTPQAFVRAQWHPAPCTPVALCHPSTQHGSCRPGDSPRLPWPPESSPLQRQQEILRGIADLSSSMKSLL